MARARATAYRDLAEQFGTPLYVYEAEVLEETYRALRRALPEQVDVCYSLKANPNVSVCAFLHALGAGAEVSSYVELRTALRAGVAPEDIVFLGPGKDARDLAACLDAGIHAVVCESLDEVARLDRLTAERGGRPCSVMLRVNPAFQSRGAGLAMGGKPRQFGIDEETLQGAGSFLAGLPHVRLKGIHAYMGTRFLHHEDIVGNTGRILQMADRLAARLGIPLETVDFGGGLGIAYFDRDPDVDLAALGRGITENVERFTRRHPGCRLIMELGRYLTAMSGTYVVQVQYVKESMGELFAVANGGTNHHMAAVGVGSVLKRNFPIRHLTRSGDPAPRPYTVTGPLCTPDDVIAKRVPLPEVRPGDLLGVERSGAYGPTASPGLFLGHGFPAEVMTYRGEAHLVRQRDTDDDLLAKQRLVELHTLHRTGEVPGGGP
ncbi:type III PLP-dependent enzyme [Streptomyces odontomachi]|uniref:type III PLP-dependent enzyme n=1 Tax=Streptomyces odontomachi TaxID=2944940 RepID=UPI002108C7B0|nr:type III PLP-dependent enzyme [Streptomyces sp. ODS25]